MTLTMMVYFSKWKNRCKFYFDQRPINWGTIECGTTICQLTFAWKCFRQMSFWKTVSSKRLSGLFIRSCHHNNPVQLSFGLNTCYSSLGLIITHVCVHFLMEGFPYQKSKRISFCDCEVVLEDSILQRPLKPTVLFQNSDLIVICHLWLGQST